MSKALRILVVDDDVDNARSMGELFELEGHAAVVVHTGEAAIRAYSEGTFDLAFMDVMLPGLNGVESFLEIKKLKPGAKVYMMTGFSVEELLRDAVEEGALGVFAKPVDTARVLASVRAAAEGGVVLIAEDDPDFGPQLAAMVNEAGYRAELAREGKAALARALAGGIDVLILDLRMPLLDGIEVYTSLKRAGRNIPTIIITAHPEGYASSLEALRDVGVTGVLTKPFDPMRLLERLEQLAA